jgi:hypothetical protein
VNYFSLFKFLRRFATFSLAWMGALTLLALYDKTPIEEAVREPSFAGGVIGVFIGYGMQWFFGTEEKQPK